jgi:hypothetical protein
VGPGPRGSVATHGRGRGVEEFRKRLQRVRNVGE